ncbi:MAG: GGDEF domain-containing protein [Candidatus Cloacimonetes bacterium]|nr:GGDEF domain-containing protein [Candidatus Cloacimonadota bacterium]
MKKFLIFIFLIITVYIHPTNDINNLKKSLYIVPEKEKIDILHKLASSYDILPISECITYSEQALELSKKINDKSFEINSLLIIAKLYDQSGNYESSLIYFQKYTTLKDSISQVEFEKEKKQVQRQIVLRNSFMIAFIILLNIAFIIFTRYRVKTQAHNKLEEAHIKLAEIARRDPLTDLSNRRDMLEKIEYETNRFERSHKPFTILMGDIDFFKAVNDKYGHDCGDYILKEIARIFQSSVRKQDVVGRWGGEEFMLMLPETNLDGGRIVAEKIRGKVEKAGFKYQNYEILLTITFGVSTYNTTINIDECIKKADQALYIGKRKGRNCVILFHEEDVLIG